MTTGDLLTNAAGTVYFIELFDQLFDILNCTRRNTATVHKKPYVGSREQEAFLFDMLEILKKYKFIGTQKMVRKM